MHSLMNTNAYKIIENHKGVAFVKQQQTFQIANLPPGMAQQPPTP
jgi:hypothetical protein